MFDLPLPVSLSARPVALPRGLWVDPMQLIEIDAVQAQPPKAAFAGGLQVFGRSVFHPLVGTRPIKTTLGRDHEAFRIRGRASAMIASLTPGP